jgi:hypothetical protein
MQEMDFYELSRAVQDRFTVSVRGEGQPRPLLALRAGPPREALLWSAIGGGGLLLLVLLVALGFGDLASSFALQAVPLVAAYAILAATVAISVMRVLAVVKQRWALPYKPGVYLFPAGVIDAKSDKLRVFPLSRLVTPVVGDKRLTLGFPEGESFTFTLLASGHQAEVQKTIEEAQAAVEKAHASADKKSLGVLDPLVDIGVVNPFAPTSRLARYTPFWARYVWFVGAFIGLVLAPGVWFLRNLVSDRQMLSLANKARDAASFKAYLARGGSKPEVRDVLLPRAELSEAIRDGSVEAIEKYMAAHPNSRIQSEVSVALRQAMLAELETVKKSGTVSVLNDFAKRHPNNLVDAELKQAIHAVYQAALARYKKESGVRDANVLAFVERLLAYAEKNGPKAELRFRRKNTRSMEIADAQIKKSPFFMGTTSIPSQYFDDAHARPREAAAAQAIVNRFAGAFPADILALEVGQPVVEPEGPLPPSKIPTMFVEHSAEMSGASYLSSNPRGVFVGLGMLFEVSFRLPDESKPQRYRLSAWRPPDTTISKGDYPTFEAAVYETMASEGFGQFAQRYLSTFFAKAEPKTTD